MRDDGEAQKRISAQVIEVLNDLDAYGLEPGLSGGAPADEYELEAVPIAGHLLTCGGASAAEVDAIWLHWFDETLTGVVGSEAMGVLVARLNGLTATNGDQVWI